MNLIYEKKYRLIFSPITLIPYPFPNFNGCTVEVWEWMSNLKSMAFYKNFPRQIFAKIAKIIPLIKREDSHKLDNYRPISLLPTFSKMFENAVFIQLYEYFNGSNLLYKSQYGFRSLHSTELASLEIIDIIDLDNGKLPIWVFLDLSKAFDTLDHKILWN